MRSCSTFCARSRRGYDGRMAEDASHPILPELPEEARATFQRLLGSTVRPPDRLREQIPHYVAAIERASTHGGPDIAIGKRIASGCERLLDAWHDVDDDGRRLIRAAVEYFLLARDGDDDLASPDGLDDDDAVVAAVIARLRL
jgi:hypothetical protein